jgi:hypothetical protein
MTKTHDIVPVLPFDIKKSKLDDQKLLYENKPSIDKVDAELLKGKSNYIVDDRINLVNFDKYENESYELFRLEFSTYINKKENIAIKAKLENIMTDQHLHKKDKVDKIKLLVYKLFDKDLYDHYKSIISINSSKYTEMNFDVDTYQNLEEKENNFILDDKTTQKSSVVLEGGGKYDKLINIITKLPNLEHYQVNNDRIMCNTNESKDKCNVNPHCHWTHSGCYMSVLQDMAITFVNKISEELSQNNLRALEIIQVDGYFVSDIVDYTRFTERDDQKIIRSTSNTIKKVLSETFGKETVPVKIGRKKTIKGEINYQQLNADNPLIDMRTFYIQRIIENNITMFRSYVNGYYWLRNKYNDVEGRNLGYYSVLQTDLSNYFRSLVIDWLNDATNSKYVKKELSQYLEIKKTSKNSVSEFIIKLAKDVPVMTNCVIELHVLSKINRIPIVIYNDQNIPVYIFEKGVVYDRTIDSKIPEMYVKHIKGENKNAINLRFSYLTNTKIPENAEVMYFK